MDERVLGAHRSDRITRGFIFGLVTGIVIAAIGIVGGAHPTTQVVLSAAALALFVVHALARGARGVRPAAFAGVAAVAIAFTLLQLLPLPSPLVGFLSPLARDLRRETGAGWFMPLTLDVPATWLAVARGATCSALLIVVAGSVRTTMSARRFLWMLAAVGGTLAVIAFGQRIIGTSKILGIYEPRSQPGFGVFGTFVDVNHAASVFALTALIAYGLALDSGRGRRPIAIGIALLTTAALVYSGSRAGLVGFGVGGALLVLVVVGRRAGLAHAAAVALVLVLAGAAIALWSNEGLRARMSIPAEQQWNNQKTRGWAEGLRMAADYRWTGVGRGAFESPIVAYRSDDEAVRLVYPENFIVQMASEWGIPATLILFAMVLACSRRLAPTFIRLSAPIVAAGCGVIAVVVHEIADFGLELPGVALPTVVALAVVVGAIGAERRKSSTRRGRRLTAPMTAALAGSWLLALVGAAWATRHTLDADYQRLVAQPDPALVSAAITRHPADDYLELIAARHDMREHPGEAMHHLNRALRLHPVNSLAHHLAARLLAATQRPAQAALEYRLAIQCGMVVDYNELLRVLGEHIVEAVPQRPDALIDLARRLYALGRPREADAALQRAVEVSDAPEPMLAARVSTALEFGATAALDADARDLLRVATQPDSFALAARALAQAGERDRAYAAVDDGLRAHATDSSLLLAGARLRLEGNDLANARILIGRASTTTLTLAQREEQQELLAQIAERSGDVDTAVAAHARARLIGKQLHDMRQGSAGNPP